MASNDAALFPVEKGLAVALEMMKEMLLNHGHVDIVFADPSGETRATGRIFSITHFPLLFNDGNVLDMIDKHGPISYMEPHIDKGLITIGYMPKGIIAKAEGATLN